MTADLGFAADIAVQLGRVADGLQAAERYRVRCMGALQRVPVVSTVVEGSGTIDQPDALGAKTGYYWSIRRLTCYGFSAGLVTVYRNIAGGEPLVPYPQTGVATFGRGEMMLAPGERMIAVGTGITGSFQLVGEADCFESWYLPEYVG